jgi:hypothetical protein
VIADRGGQVALLDEHVEANARITGAAGMVLLILLAAEGFTILGIRRMLVAHAFIGFLLVPPVLLKTASVGYRFTRYYLGDQRYRQAGPPALLMRMLGPVLVILTFAVLGTGIELWLFGARYGDQWLAWHKGSFILWFFAMTIHVVAYAGQSSRLALADWRGGVKGVFTRRSLLVGTLILGVALAMAMLLISSPFVPAPEAG